MLVGERNLAAVALREIPDPPGIRQAKTLPASAYSSAEFHERERDARSSNATGCAPASSTRCRLPGSWTARVVGGLPVLFVRDKAGELRAFLNVCRHRASPLCEDGETHTGSLIRCPYHSWLYQLDGSLARASGVGEPEGFDVADYSLKPVQLAEWRRMVFVCFDESSGAARRRSTRPGDRCVSAGVDGAGAVGDQRAARSTGRCCSRTTARTTTRRSSIRSSTRAPARTTRWSPTESSCTRGTGHCDRRSHASTRSAPPCCPASPAGRNWRRYRWTARTASADTSRSGRT